MKGIELPEKEKQKKTSAELLAAFSTEGFDEYNIDAFNKLIKEHGLHPETEILDLVKSTITEREMSSKAMELQYEAYKILDAFIHCSPIEACEFLSRAFDFTCTNDSDYAVKSKFFTIVSMYFFSTLSLGGSYDEGNQQLAEQDILVQELRRAVNNKQGSVLLNTYAQALLNECLSGDSEKESGLGSNSENFDWQPFLIAPQQYAFNTESSFWLMCAHDEERSRHGMYISDVEDYEKIKELLDSYNNKNEKVMPQEVYDNLQTYFHLAVRKEINASPENKEESLEYGAEDLVIYRDLNKPFFRRAIAESTGIDLSTLDIPVQFQLLQYMKTADYHDMKSIAVFAKDFGRDGLTTFLSLEHGGTDMGKKILLLGQQLPKESADLLFKTYGDIIDAVERVGDLLQEANKDTDPADLAQAKESLYLQGKNLLSTYAQKLRVCENEECNAVAQDLVSRLQLAQQSIHAFAAVSRTLADKGLFSFESFKDIHLTYQSAPLPEKMASDIRAIHTINTQQYPDALREYWYGTLDTALAEYNPRQVFVVVQLKEDVLAAMRVIEQEDGSWYGASFNVNPNIMGSRIGTELLKEVIAELSKDKPFVADCYEHNPMLQTYLGAFDFEITNSYDNYNETGTRVHQITRFPKVEEDHATADQK